MNSKKEPYKLKMICKGLYGGWAQTCLIGGQESADEF